MDYILIVPLAALLTFISLLFLQLYSRHSQYLSSLVGSEFELPPLGVLRLILHGQIVSARNFEYDDLFVRYVINVPSQGK